MSENKDKGEPIDEDFPDMDTLIKSLGESCLDKPLPEGYRDNVWAVTHVYKGLEVIRNIDKVNGTKYYTVVNNANGTHIHVKGKNIAHRVCDCYIDFINGKNISEYSKNYRKGALALAGYNTK